MMEPGSQKRRSQCRRTISIRQWLLPSAVADARVRKELCSGPVELGEGREKLIHWAAYHFTYSQAGCQTLVGQIPWKVSIQS